MRYDLAGELPFWQRVRGEDVHIESWPWPPSIFRRWVEGRTPHRYCLKVCPELWKSELRFAVVEFRRCEDRRHALAVGGESIDGDGEVGDDADRSLSLAALRT
jgi:hypothetical protein